MKMYQALANVAMALNNPALKGRGLDIQTQYFDQLVKRLPSGAGFDAGTEFVSNISGSKRLHFRTAFHHHDYTGYVGWTEHEVIVTPCLDSTMINIRITGKNKHDIKDYIFEVFYTMLTEEAPELVIESEEKAA